jgi:transposase-like protein
MMQIHPQARTTPAVRTEIARSTEPTSVVARRYGISDETVRKWRKRGEHAVEDRCSRVIGHFDKECIPE